MKILVYGLALVVMSSMPALAQKSRLDMDNDRFDPGFIASMKRVETSCQVPEFFEDDVVYFRCGGRMIFVPQAHVLGAMTPNQSFSCMVGRIKTGTFTAEDCHQRELATTLQRR